MRVFRINSKIDTNVMNSLYRMLDEFSDYMYDIEPTSYSSSKIVFDTKEF